MNLSQWVKSPHEENEKLDILLQIIRLLIFKGRGRGTIFPDFYLVDENNDVLFDDAFPNNGNNDNELLKLFRPPETKRVFYGDDLEKGDVFSLGLLLYFLEFGEPCYVERSASSGFSFFKPKVKNIQPSAFMANNASLTETLIQRMTAYNPQDRPVLKSVLSKLNSGMCKFEIALENIRTGERVVVVTRCFSDSESCEFIPEDRYIIDLVTLTPISTDPITIPFRLSEKQYTIKVDYGGEGRWHNVRKKAGSDTLSLTKATEDEASIVPKSSAALCFCDTAFDINGDGIFCESNNLTYEIGVYEHTRGNKRKEIAFIRKGSIATEERLEARFLSVLRERFKAVYDMSFVAVYGNPSPAIIKTINDLFPEVVNIYTLSDDDILKGTKLYLEQNANVNTKSIDDSVDSDIRTRPHRITH